MLERVSFVRLLCGSLLQLFFVSYRVSVALSRVSFVGLFFCCSGSLLQVSCVGLFCRSFSRYMGLFSEIHMTQTRKEEEASSKLRWSLLCDILQVSFVGLFCVVFVQVSFVGLFCRSLL